MENGFQQTDTSNSLKNNICILLFASFCAAFSIFILSFIKDVFSEMLLLTSSSKIYAAIAVFGFYALILILVPIFIGVKKGRKAGLLLVALELFWIIIIVFLDSHFFSSKDEGFGLPEKPVIYLYPTKKEQVSVQLDYSGTVTDAYPQFDDQKSQIWNVVAFPDGHLINSSDDKEYSYLFWEGLDNHQYDLSTGFVAKGSDTASFLQDQLAKMGLQPKEYNEFIVYWLPKMQHNPYNLIHFAETEYTDLAKLNILPKPDSLLRIFMVYKPLDYPIAIQPQSFPIFERKGFVVVEWGGEEQK